MEDYYECEYAEDIPNAAEIKRNQIFDFLVLNWEMCIV